MIKRLLNTVFIILVFFASINAQTGLVINEVMSNNGSFTTDEDGDNEDWIEIYNGSGAAVNLLNYGLTDDAANLGKWKFPNVTIPNGGYLLVWASNKNRKPGTDAPTVGIVNKRYENVKGTSIASLTGFVNYPNNPDSRYIVSSLQSATGLMDEFGQSYYGIFTAPATGNYIFSISGKNDATFALSTDANPANLTVRCSASSTSPGTFNSSSAIALVAGQQYYFRALHKENESFYSATIADHLTVKVQYPSGAVENPMLSSNCTVPYTELHSNFTIATLGETITLSNPAGVLISSLNAVDLSKNNLSYGRSPNGSGTNAFFETPTPGAINNSTAFQGVLPKPTFSQIGGFFSSNQSISITNSDATAGILYTLDGSDPKASTIGGVNYNYKNVYPNQTGTATFGSILTKQIRTYNYTAPLSLSNRSKTPGVNDISTISSTTTSTASYLPTAENVSMGNVVRAVATKTGWINSDVATENYFIFPAGAAKYTLPVMSINTHTPDFVGYENGIHVPGKDYDDLRMTNGSGTTTWQLNEGNFTREGSISERRANMAFIKNGVSVLNQDIGIRIQGDATRYLPVKTIRMYPRSEYGGASTFNYPFYPNDATNSFKRMFMRNSSQDYEYTLLRDGLIQNSVKHLNFLTQKYTPIITFINGEYYGLTDLRERIDSKYLEDKFAVAEAEMDIINCNGRRGAEAKDGDLNHFNALMDYVKTNSLATQSNFDYVTTQLDPESITDYYITGVYYNSVDWPYNNNTFWRKKTAYNPAAPFGQDGRYRWILYGTEISMGFNTTFPVSPAATTNMLADLFSTATQTGDLALQYSEWGSLFIRKMINNPAYKNQFINRFADLLNTAFLPSRLTAKLDSMKTVLTPEIPEYATRWNVMGNTSAATTWPNNAAVITNYINQHHPLQRDHIRAKWGISSNQNVVLNVSNPAHGYIKINTIDIKNGTPGVAAQPYPWTGVYFNGIPITLTANALPGYTFVNWSGASSATTETITITPTADLALTANFVPNAGPTPVYFWLMNSALTNNAPLTSINSTFSLPSTPAVLSFSSALGTAYPFVSTDLANYRNSDMERRNLPTDINYLPEANNDIAYVSTNVLGIQIKPVFNNGGAENMMTFNMPTTGYKDIKFAFASSQETAANSLIIEYTLDKNNPNWVSFANSSNTATYQLFNYDFSTILGVENNPNFAVRIRFGGLLTVSPVRVNFNNISLIGTPIASKLAINATVTPVNCTNLNSGAITLTLTNGQAPYTYSWSNGATTKDISGIAAGSYAVTVTDNLGATFVRNISVSSANPEASISTDRTTANCSYPSPTLTANIGSSYVWNTSPVQTTRTITVSPVVNTTYTVTVTNSNGCTATASQTIIVDKSLSPTITPSRTALNCTNPSATLIANSGGTYLWSTGATTASIAVSPTTSTTYTVTVTGRNGCTATQSQLITVDKTAPTATISSDFTTVNCTNPIANLTAGGGGTYLWSNAATTSGISVSPTANTTYTVTVTSANGCTSTKSQAIIVDKTTTATIAADRTTVTCTNPSATLTAGGGSSFTWDTNPTQSTAAIIINPTTNTTYTVTVTGSNGCTSTKSQLITVDKTAPTATIGNNRTTVNCTNASATLTAGGGLSYAWDSGQNTAAITISPTINTTYTVTVTGNNGCTSTKSQAIIVDKTAPTATISSDKTSLNCTNPTAIITTGGGGTYLWSNSATTAIISVSPIVNTTYTVTVTGSNGCTSTINQAITVDKAVPTVTLSADLTDLNCTNPTANLTAGGGVSYAWSNGANTAVIAVNPAFNVTYTVTVTASDGCTASKSQSITVDKTVPTATITPNRTTVNCTNQSATLTAGGGTSYAWSSGQNTVAITISPTINTTYTVTVTGSNGCTSTKSQLISVDKTLPTASISAPATQITCATPSITLTAMGGGTYAWTGGTTNNTLAVNSAGTYVVTVTSANGCTATASQQITVDNSVVTATISTDFTTVNCTNPTANLTAGGGGTYLWSNAATTSGISVSPTANTTYTVTVTSSNGCTSTKSQTINVDKTITATIASDRTTVTCTNPSATLTAGGGASYVWDTNPTQSTAAITINPTINTTYTVTVTGSNGCTSTKSQAIVVDKTAPTATISPNRTTVNCTNQSATLTAGGGISYLWDSGQNTAAITISPTINTTYTVTVTGSNGCTSTKSQAIIVDKTAPTATISADKTSLNCTNPTASLTAGGGGTYLWSNSATTSMISVSPTTNTTYTVTVTGGNGCTSTKSQAISVDKTAPTVTLSPNFTALNCTNTTANLTAGGGGSYLWSTNATTAIINVSPTATTTYTVTVTASNGCTATKSQAITVDKVAPTATITSNRTTVNCTNPSATLTGGGGASYAWNSGQNTAAITISPTINTTYIVTVTGSNGCTSTKTQAIVVDKTTPTAAISAPNTQLTCSTPTATLTASGGGTYAWTGGTTNSTLSVNAAGTYAVTVTAANGCKSNSSINITSISCVENTAYLEAECAIVGSNFAITTDANASNGSFVNFSGADNSADGPTTSDGWVRFTTSNLNAGNYYIFARTLITAVGNNFNSYWVRVNEGAWKKFNDIPTTPSWAWNIVWDSDVSQTGATFPFLAGVNTIDFGMRETATKIDKILIKANSTAVTGIGDLGNTPSISGVNTLCPGSTTTLTASDGNKYLWNTGATTNSIIATAGNYTVTVTNNVGCPTVANKTITALDAPIAAISTPTTQLTCGIPNITLSASGAGTYEWTGGSTSNTLSVNSAGTYSVTVTGTNGCTATASQQITIDNTPATASISADRTAVTCTNPTATLTATGLAGSTYQWNTNPDQTSASITVSPTITTTYSVVVTASNGCTAVANQTISIDNVAPTATISADFTTLDCTNPTVNLTAQGGASFSWSSGETTSSISVSPTINTTYTVTVTGSNGCVSTKSQLISVDKTNPTATISSDFTSLNCTNPTATLTSTGGGTYAWSTGETTNSIAVSPNTNTTYSVTVTGSNGCISTKSLLISVDKTVPNASISADFISLNCTNPTAILTASGGGNYLWSTGETTNSISVSPTENTTYSVTVTGSNGCISTKNQIILVDKTIPTASISADFTTLNCTNTSANLTAGGGGTYLWSNLATTASISVSPTINTTYTVTITGSNGCSSTKSQEIVVDKTLPNATLSADFTSLNCANPTANLTANGGGTYAWSTGETTNSIGVSPTSNTTYTVTVTGSNGCASTKNLLISVDKTVPNASISADFTSLNCTNPTATLTASGGGNYLWSTGETTNSITISPTENTTYSVTVTGSNGCISTKSQLISVDKTIPTASISADFTTLNCTNTSTNLTAGGGGTYLWSNLATTASISVNPTANTTYTVTVTGSNGCSSTKSQEIVVDKTLPNATLSADFTSLNCANPTANLTANGGGTYAWSTGDTTNSIAVSPNTNTTYSVTVTGSNGCTSSKNLLISVDKTVPNASISTDFTSLNCTNPTATLTAGGGGNYLWSTGETTNSITISPTENTTYSVTVTGSNGCISVKNQAISVDKTIPTVSISADFTTLNCTNTYANLTAGGGGTYLWSNLATTASISVSPAINTTYTVTVTGSNGCTSTKSQLISVDKTLPSNQITSSNGLELNCNFANTTLSVSAIGTYVWSNLASTQSIIVSASGTYSVTITGANGCTNIGNITITKIEQIQVSPTITNASCNTSNGSINLSIAGGAVPLTFNWSNGATTKDITGLSAGTYTVSVSDRNGCSAALSIQVTKPISGSISSSVWVDTNGNGLQEVTETSLDGVPVKLFLANPDGTPNGLEVQNTATASGGKYNFANICAGNYVIKFETVGNYVRTFKPNNSSKDLLDSDANPSTGFTNLIALSEGENDLTNQAGYYLPSKIGGIVFKDVNGNNIKNAEDTGLAGVDIALTGTNGGGQNVALNTVSGANGVYSFDNLAPGTYLVTINNNLVPQNSMNKNSSAKIQLADVYVASSTNTFNVNVGSGTDTQIYNAGYFVPAKISSTIWDDQNKNGIRDNGEPGLANISIKINGVEGDGVVVSPISITSDANGLFSFGNLSPGNYTITFTSPVGYIFTDSNIGSDENIDSDAVNGVVNNVQIISGETISNISAGFKTAIALAVDLLDFNGKIANNQAVLNWKVANEADFSNYEIQRSTNNLEFSSIGNVKAANKTHYNFVDENPEKALNYYRLKMINNDGTFKFSKIIALDFGKETIFVITENPAVNGAFNLYTNAPIQKFVLTNILGIELPINSFEMSKNNYKVFVQSPVSGLYFLKLNDGKNHIIRKVLVP